MSASIWSGWERGYVVGAELEVGGEEVEVDVDVGAGRVGAPLDRDDDDGGGGTGGGISILSGPEYHRRIVSVICIREW